MQDDDSSELLLDDAEWLARQMEGLTTEIEVLSPSMWAEAHRYLPPELTSLPGFYSFDVAPYLREIVDCLALDSPVREVSLMKGVQIGATVGVLENTIGYYIAHVKTAPMMFVTADAELAKLRLETNVLTMIRQSGLSHLIKSSDEGNRRKTGATAKRIEWLGGGYLVPFGAQNANKLRSISIQVLLRDEIDGWPNVVGKDGDPIKLSAARTSAYEGSRKVVDLSTPLIKGTSKIADRYALGDQRKYFVRCLNCEQPQVLRWRHTNPDTGETAGIVWEMEGSRLLVDSVRYRCVECGHEHRNEDKQRLLAESNAEWRPTAVPAMPWHRSYHLSALYSPPGMQTWAACVQQWLEAWDDQRAKPRDLGKLQVFYNNVLGEPFELRGEKIRFERVSSHRRSDYRFGHIPNEFAVRSLGSPVALLTCAVDVHKDNLAVAVFGWARGRRAVLVDYWRFEGNAEDLNDLGTWGRLVDLIENREYEADDGRRYRIQLTLIDAGYLADVVYRFAAQYEGGVVPIRGRDSAPKNAAIKHFGPLNNPLGIAAFSITVDLYKDRWSVALRGSWDGLDLQPRPFFNAPSDITDAQLKELTTETKQEKVDKRTNRKVGFVWYRPSGARNELWDLLVYNDAALDLLAWDTCRRQFGLPVVNLEAFFDFALDTGCFFADPG